MATPKEALTATVQPVNIDQHAKASPPNRAMANVDQLQFTNNDPTNTATVTFLGAAANAFGASSVSIPPNGTSGPLTPTESNLIVDYDVTVGMASAGPFSIAVGSGPLEIDILDSTGNTNLLYAAIPNNGSLFFRNKTTNETATVDFGEANVLFDNGNSVTSQTVAASSSADVLTGRGTNKDVSYTVGMAPNTAARVMTANGSIKVGQT